ncbi:restriction endonuclease subunit S [Leucobacter chromiiresistens]|uniref:Type I restriction enzyme, S subunit n=1 Tax=Leucobacter chromiiresistens TaxID=1079994 RepID=A0A1H0Z5I7_9MICO|nr:restriction endonuclease subunit S [Leucobacter chromiiresistens]SDQ22366.1 type I restriction enzyme, S subunit [Leucobacter chromiiresistens]
MRETAPLWKFGEVNPLSVDFKELAEGTVVSFMPLEAVWPGGRADYAGRLAWSNKQSYTQFSRGDILIPKITPTFEAGRTIIAEIDTELGLASTEVHVVRARDTADARFLQYCFQSQPFLDEGASALQGVGNLRRITPRFVQELRVLDVDYDSQQRIADYLDRETGEIDVMIAKMDELAGQLEERRSAAILRELQSVPNRVQLTLVVDIASGSGFPDKYQGVSSEELPFYKVGSLSSAINGYLAYDENTVSRSTAVELGARVIPPGSILMAKIGAALMLARFVQTTKPACIDNNMQALVPREGVVNPRFLAYAMTEISISSLVKNGPVPTVDVIGLKMTHISYPSTLSEQQRIADHLDEVTGKIDAMLAKVAELKSLLTERRAALITDVVTGRKDVA